MKYFLWVVVPYSAFALFVAGHVWRYRRDRFGSDRHPAGSRRIEGTGATLFRTGILLVIVTRLLVMAFPTLRSQPYGAPHMAVIAVELLGMALTVSGAVLLAVPHMIAGTPRRLVSPVDRLTVPVLIFTLMSGLLIQFGSNSYLGEYRTAGTLFRWFRSLLTLHPHPDYMHSAPTPYQARGLIVMLLIAIWPYTRLSGTLAAPIIYWCGRLYRAATRVLGSRSKTAT
ncbi:respiratory nitrate reductase subunit gamma [Nocardia aurantia]|uniref:Nitrate reductase-like protein NarX n=1 Tax=Nocardia aurantia TaxID=2585199 RepID=A0A7K0DT70_9NOCA|nr:respiratory nitrate reductase subunit gamma [Nocardia aurantia]MQY28542.1 Nitrate reductase-like protein NarX [Nocardia aurantia]